MKVDVMVDVKSLSAHATCCFVFSRKKPELFLFPVGRDADVLDAPTREGGVGG